MNGVSEQRESIGRLIPAVTLGEEESAGRYDISAKMTRDGSRWAYQWVKAQNGTVIATLA